MSAAPPSLSELLALIGEAPEAAKAVLDANWQRLVVLGIVQGADDIAIAEWNEANPYRPGKPYPERPTDLPITLEHLERSARDLLQGLAKSPDSDLAKLLPRLPSLASKPL